MSRGPSHRTCRELDDMSEHGSPGMGKRGVSRPMPLMGGHDHGDDDHAQHEHADEGDNEKSGHQHDAGGDGHEMSHDDRRQMLAMHHQQTLWVYWTLVMLGTWTALAPFTFGYLNE